MEPTVTDEQVKPQDGMQTYAMACPAFELLMGGAAGPGKSWVLCVDALGVQFENTPLGKRAIDVPEYRAVIFRRESGELAKLVDESQKYYPSFGASFTLTRPGEPGPSWTFPSGAKIFLCHMHEEKDRHNHDSSEYQYVGFDELTQFTLTQYLHLFSRCRSTVPYLFPRVRSATNPVGIGLWWVRARFIKNIKPYVTNFFIADGEPKENPQGKNVPKGTPDAIARCFIPGRLHENKILMATDPDYAARIKQLGPMMERALLGADWYAFGGDFFKMFDYGNEVIPPFKIDPAWQLIGSLDPGYSSPCSFGLNACDLDGNVYRVATYYEKERSPDQHAAAINQFIGECKYTDGRQPSMIVAGHDAWAKKDRFAVTASLRTFADMFSDAGLLLARAQIDRFNGWTTWRGLMPGRYFVFRDLNNSLLEEMSNVPADEKKPEDIKGSGNDSNIADHCFVAGTRVLTATGYKPIEIVEVGEAVYTRSGFRRVLATHRLCDKKVREYMISGKPITCTPSHKFHTNKGWVRAEALDARHEVTRVNIWRYALCRIAQLRALSLAASLIEGIQIPRTLASEITFGPTDPSASMGMVISTGRYGGVSTVPSPPITTSTTRMGIPSIIASKIWNVWRGRITSPVTQQRGPLTSESECVSTLIELDPSPRHGIQAKMGSVGTANTPRKRLPTGHTSFLTSTVSIAANLFGQRRWEASFVTPTARQERSADVYDLTVQGEHEYCAEGFIVHNSLDDQRYGIMGLWQAIATKVPVKPPPPANMDEMTTPTYLETIFSRKLKQAKRMVKV